MVKCVRKVAILRAVSLVSILVLISSAAFASQMTEQAERVVRDLIRDSHQRGRVIFTETNESPLSFSESKVSGRGTITNYGGRDELKFSYSMKIHQDDLRVRDASVELSDGRKLTSKSDYRQTSGSRFEIARVTSPRWNEILHTVAVEFRGTGPKNTSVIVTVTDPSNHTRARRTAQVNSQGNWNFTTSLSSDSYRVTVSDGRRNNDIEEVPFVVENPSNGSNHSSDTTHSTENRPAEESRIISITNPKNGAIFDIPRILFSGTSTASIVKVTVFSGSRKVYSSRLSVSQNIWKASATLGTGEFRIIAETDDFQHKDEAAFTVHYTLK